MGRGDVAEALFKQGFSCAQAIFAAYAQDYGLDKEVALKIAQPFGGIVAGLRGECGSVTGAYMVIGLIYGSTDVEAGEAKCQTYEKVKLFSKRFKEVHQSTVCRDLLEGRLGNQYDVCKEYVRTACEILDEIIDIEA